MNFSAIDRWKIGTGFACMIFLSIALTLISVFSLRSVISASSNDGTVALVESLIRLERIDNLDDAISNDLRAYLRGDESALLRIKQGQQAVRAEWEYFHNGDIDSGGRAVNAALLDAISDYRRSVDTVLAKKQFGKPMSLAAALRTLEQATGLSERRVDLAIKHLEQHQHTLHAETMARAHEAQSFATKVVVLVGGLTVLAGIAMVGLVVGTLKKMNRTEQQLYRALQARDDFISIASHELNTPLTALSLQMQVVRRGLIKTAENRDALPLPRFLKTIDKAEEQAHRISALLKQLLDLTRIRSGKLVLDRTETDLCRLVQDVVARTKEQALAREIPIFIEADETVVGRWDPVRIEQVITNLVANAVKYGARKPVQVAVSKMGDSALIEVKDQGVGISPEMLPRIFDRFERAHSQRAVAGLGLGLYIVRQVVAAHGGTVTVASALGEGSSFQVRLPFAVC